MLTLRTFRVLTTLAALSALFALPYVAPPALAGQFVDVSEEVLPSVSTSTGAGIGDFNRDGLPDIFSPKSGIFLNQKTSPVFVSAPVNVDGSLYDWAPKSHQSGHLGDLNNDGYLDIVCDPLWVFLSNSPSGFQEQRNIFRPNFTLFDYDLDGDLDFLDGDLLIHENTLETGTVDFSLPATQLLPNELDIGTGQPITADYDNDGDEDILFDRGFWIVPPAPRTFLGTIFLRNDGNGNFTKLDLAGPNTIFLHADGSPWIDFGKDYDWSGGSIFFDYNNDGFLDYLNVNTTGAENKGVLLMQNTGSPNYQFIDRTQMAGLSEGQIDIANFNGATYGDIDNDGDLDIVLTVNRDFESWGIKIWKNMYKETGQTMFEDATETLLSPGPGVGAIVYGVSLFDHNQDGRLDIFFPILNGGIALLENRIPEALKRNYLKVTLEGTISNRSAYGAKVYLYPGITDFTFDELLGSQEMGNRENNRTSVLAPLHFGLGSEQGTFIVKVDWPSGITQKINAKANSTVHIIEEIPEGVFLGIGDFGQVDNVDHNWKRVIFTSGRFRGTPVVIAKPVSTAGGEPAHIRIRNVSKDGFELKVEEWAYLDGPHKTEKVGFLAIPPGHYKNILGTGLTVDAGRITPVVDSWVQRDYQQSFEEIPTLLTQSQTYRGRDPIVTRNKIDQENAVKAKNGFKVRIQEEEEKDLDANDRHNAETVGHIAMTLPEGIKTLSLPGIRLEVQTKRARVTHDRKTYWFSRGFFTTPPVLLADMQTSNGPDTASLRRKNLTAGRVDFFIEDEKSLDDEITHTEEIIGYVAIEHIK